jgi:hypothetical protein
MAPCCGKSFRGKCRPRWPRQSRLLIVMLWEIPCSPSLIHKDRDRPRGITTIPGDRGNSIALITGTRGEMKGQITGMERHKWPQWRKNKGAPAVASVQDMRAISSLSSRSSKRSPSRRRMSGSTRIPAAEPARRGSGQSIRWVWPWTLVCFTHSSRVSRQII